MKAGTLLPEAPTGLGKTLGTLFPALMAMPAAKQDRLFYLTCRPLPGSWRWMWMLRTQDEPQPLPLRTLELVSKDDACEHPDKACHELAPAKASTACRTPGPRRCRAKAVKPAELGENRRRS